jgi:hypothetical protein
MQVARVDMPFISITRFIMRSGGCVKQPPEIISMANVSRQLHRRQLGRTAESTAESLRGTTEADPDIGDTKSQNAQRGQYDVLGLQQFDPFATTAFSFPGHPNGD